MYVTWLVILLLSMGFDIICNNILVNDINYRTTMMYVDYKSTI